MNKWVYTLTKHIFSSVENGYRNLHLASSSEAKGPSILLRLEGRERRRHIENRKEKRKGPGFKNSSHFHTPLNPTHQSPLPQSPTQMTIQRFQINEKINEENPKAKKN